MLNRMISFILCMAMVLSMLPAQAVALETEPQPMEVILETEPAEEEAEPAEEKTEYLNSVQATEAMEIVEVTEATAVACEHDYEAVVTDPTCTAQGYTTHTCTVCGESFMDNYVDAIGHTYENGSCTGCGDTISPYLQQLPEHIIGCTDLYDSLVPVKGYYTASKYDTSNGAVLSVVIPVEPGDRIAASSFGPVSENKGSVNGIRVTYLLGDKIVTSLSAGEVYSGYTSNGYITVPDGVDAVCVPWWAPSDSNWLTLRQISKDFAIHRPRQVFAQAPTCTEKGYTAGEICEICNASLGEREVIHPIGHVYSGDSCTVCGAVNLQAVLDGKYVSILGDSISTFNGYSNDATVNTTIGGNSPRYDAGTADTKPGSYCLLENVDDTWWMHFANRSGMKLLVNNSWAGSQVFGGQTSDGRVIPAAYLERCINLHDNTVENNPNNAPINPDVIFVYLGINDYNFNRSNVGNGAVDYASLINGDGIYVTPTTFGEAYGIMLHKMRNAYPDTQIFAMTLLPENLYSVDKAVWEQHNAYIRGAAEYYDIPLVDLAANCAITWENYSGYMIDRIHPTTAGMKLISDCIEAELAAYYKENPPHTHSYKTVTTAPTCTQQGYTTYTCECGDRYVADLLDATGHVFENGSCTVCGEAVPSLAGKTISILGASISTYAGTSNGSAADISNSTIRNNVKYYPNSTIPEVTLNDTWWMQVAKDLGLRLLVNNAWSGSAILLERSGTVGAYVDRCVQLHDNTGDNAGEEPDIICIQMGFNDFSYGKDTLGTADIDYNTLITADGYGTPTTTMEATAIMLDKMVKRYPNAEIYMFNHFKRIGQSASDTALMEKLNASIATVCARYDVTVVDLYTALTEEEHIGDGRLHPNRMGMDTISEAVKEAIISNTNYAVDTHTVTLNLDGVTADYVDSRIVVSGDAFSVALNAADEMKVTVVMGGKDITENTYADGMVTIDAVTADVSITAECIHTPRDYRWEFNGTDLVCVSGDNALTKNAGTTTNGVFDKTRYTLENAVVLLHDLPWSVEWKSEGTFKNSNGSSGARIFTSTDVNADYNARYIFKSATNWLVAMGEKDTKGSHNYGIALGDYGIDGSVSHVYRLENHIAADGSNMIYLFVDGEEIGPMNHYYVGTADQNTTSDCLSGKDFVFPYMGTDTHGFTNASIEYIQVFESHIHSYESVVTAPSCTEQGYTTYTCECGDSYVADLMDAEGHTYENGICTICSAEHPNLANYEGKVISILGDSISTFAGYIPVADGFNLEHLARYPQNDLLTDVNETWWMQVIARLGGKLGINDSWRGSMVSGAAAVTTGSTGPNASMANLQRIRNLGANGTPDVILFYGGTNDYAHLSAIGTFDPATAPAEVDLTTTSWNNLADAYVQTLLRLRYYYPDAVIVSMLPTYTASYYSNTKLAQGNAVLAEICGHYGIPCLDLRSSGVTAAHLPDGIHPGAEGMDLITDAVMELLLSQYDLEAGENVVYSVTHDLSSVSASLGYFKGVTHGSAFSESLTGDDLDVTVTMDGMDITNLCYADGKITVPSVTGDLTITAKGRFNADGHLQMLPDSLCCGTNLWGVLEHDKQYYTADGWGIHSSGRVYSVTFPVSESDRIYATSFGAGSVNGSGGTNGIRVTYFLEDGSVRSVSPGSIYSEFSANGYLTMPQGSLAISVPMWTVSDSNVLYILNRDHGFGNWKLQDQPGEKYRQCSICGYVESCALDPVENRLYLEAVMLNGGTSVWIDGREFAVQTDGDIIYVDLPDGNAKTMTVYTYGTSEGKEYPVSMKVWTLENREGLYIATHQSVFEDILQYAGSSIRVTGKKGIRMITAIDQADKTALTGDGLAGYTLKEYGTVVAWVNQISESKPLVLGKPYVRSNYAYKKDVVDPVFAYKDGKMQYTNVLVNFSDAQCSKDIAMRPYMILTDGEADITLYGGIVERSIGYIALQNKDTFTAGTEEYNYIWGIIRSVYGDAYDE